MALRHAQENPEIYGPDYQNVRLVSELVSAVDEEDYYDIKLSFRPVGRFDGSPGVEQFVISKNGTIELRQLLEFPTVEASDVGRRTSSTPTPPAVPPRLPVESGASSRRAGRMPKWLLFGGLSATVISVIAIAVAMTAGGNGGRQEEVKVTREVPVTVVVQKVTTQEVEVTREVPVTRVVEVPVTRVVPETTIIMVTPELTRSSSLAGTTWRFVYTGTKESYGRDNTWSKSIEFFSDGRWMVRNIEPFADIEHEYWEQSGDIVHLYSNDKYTTYVGTVSGDGMSGTASNVLGKSWTWEGFLVD